MKKLLPILALLLLSCSIHAQINQPPTMNFWTEYGPAQINRLNDRVFIGAAAYNDGRLHNQTPDWLEAMRQSTTNNSQLASISTLGMIAVTAGSRTSDFFSNWSMGTIGFNGWAINDAVGKHRTAYAGYFEARRYPGTWYTQGVEINMVNYDKVGVHNPYAMFPDGLTPALWLASGGEQASLPASLALGIVDNGTRFTKGIVFKANALVGTDGLGVGSAVAIEMARGQRTQWADQNGVRGYIDSDYVSFPVAHYDAKEVHLSGGGTLYSQNNKLYFRGDNGVVTQIAPAVTKGN